MKRRFATADELKAVVGETLGPSRWREIDQARIDRFAAATGDYQWIHTDPERAGRDSPWGETVAHGYLTLSLTPPLLDEIFAFSGAKLRINYGLNRLRFPAPVLCGSRVRLHPCRGVQGGRAGGLRPPL